MGDMSQAMRGFIEVSGGISAHAWNADMTQLAIAPNNNELHILEVEGGALTEKHVYEKEHTQTITAIDWAPRSNHIVSCSQDRTASVWTMTEGVWKPKMVVLKSFDRAATSVRWSPCETRFAVGSGAKQLQICAYEEENDWWIGKPVREGIDSTVFDVAFHPSSLLIAAGGCDKKICVYSVIIKALDSKAAAKEIFGDGRPPKFGECLASIDVGAWVNAVCFSPSGTTLAAATHDSKAHFLQLNYGTGVEVVTATNIRLKGLPINKLAFLDEGVCVGVGWDMVPLKLTGAGEAWTCEGSMDSTKKKGSSKKSAAEEWANRADRAGQAKHEHSTTHENTISSIFVKPGSNTDFTTAGLDGRVVFWNASSLEGSFAGLKLRS